MAIFDLFGKKSKTPPQMYNDTFPTPSSRQSEDEWKPEPKFVPEPKPTKPTPLVYNLKNFPFDNITKTWDLGNPVIHYHFMIIVDLIKNQPFNKQEDLLITIDKLLSMGWKPPEEVLLKKPTVPEPKPVPPTNSDEELDEDK